MDVALVERGLTASRERAQEAIRAGLVEVNGKPVTRPAHRIGDTDQLVVTGDPIGYVGRGGLKLEAALDRFQIDPAGLTCLDVGASTGGFTDCLLRRGAAHVFAVDVGRDQLHPDLRGDSRVTVLEGTDIRNLEQLPEVPSLAAVDVSFISLAQVLPAVARLLSPHGRIVALIKPQFEVGRQGLGKGGIVKDPRQHTLAVEKVLDCGRAAGFRPSEVEVSPVLGTEGNREFLVVLTR